MKEGIEKRARTPLATTIDRHLPAPFARTTRFTTPEFVRRFYVALATQPPDLSLSKEAEACPYAYGARRPSYSFFLDYLARAVSF